MGFLSGCYWKRHQHFMETDSGDVSAELNWGEYIRVLGGPGLVGVGPVETVGLDTEAGLPAPGRRAFLWARPGAADSPSPPIALGACCLWICEEAPTGLPAPGASCSPRRRQPGRSGGQGRSVSGVLLGALLNPHLQVQGVCGRWDGPLGIGLLHLRSLVK